MNNRIIKFRVWDKARKQWLQETETSLHAFTDYFLTFNGEIAATQGEICDHPNMEYQTNFDWYDYGTKIKTSGEERFVVQQFTGLTDKNEKEIYEGDICRYYDSFTEVYNFGQVIFKIYDDNEGYACDQHLGWIIIGRETPSHKYPGVTLHNFEKTLPDCVSYIEIIGNIFENPDLLK